MNRSGQWTRAIAVIAAMSVLHFPMSIIAVSIGFGYAAEQIEEMDARRRAGEPLSPPRTSTPLSERIFGGAFFLLMFPLIALMLLLQAAGIDLWPRTPVIEFAPFILNSIVWSAIVYNLYKLIARALRKWRREEN